jgi:hypothetical protein
VTEMDPKSMGTLSGSLWLMLAATISLGVIEPPLS